MIFFSSAFIDVAAVAVVVFKAVIAFTEFVPIAVAVLGAVAAAPFIYTAALFVVVANAVASTLGQECCCGEAHHPAATAKLFGHSQQLDLHICCVLMLLFTTLLKLP